MYVARSGLHGTFTTDSLDRRAASRMPNDSYLEATGAGITLSVSLRPQWICFSAQQRMPP